MSTKTRHTQTILLKRTLYFIVAGLFLYFFTLFYSNSAHAHSASISTSGDIVLNLIPNPNGDTTAVAENTVTISTTCPFGYNLDISSSSTDASLYYNGDPNNTSSNDHTVIAPVSGTSILNTNEWGYSTTNNSIAGSFTGLTPTYSTLLSSATSASNRQLSVYYGVKIANTARSGAYTMPTENSAPGTIVYSLTMNPVCVSVDVSYDGNNADEGTMNMVHTDVRKDDTIKLVASNFSKNGYGFAGWSADENAGAKLVDNDATNNPIVYGPQETVTISDDFFNYDTDGDGLIKLYAVWIPAEKDASNNPVFLQGWNGCANLEQATYNQTTGALDLTKRSITALTDQRDNDVYAVAKLADGKCWMIENMRIDGVATRGNNQNYPSLTNEALAQGYGKSTTYGDFSGLANPEAPWTIANITTANSLYSINGANGTIAIGAPSAAYRFPRYNNINTATRVGANDPTTNTESLYSYGNYYTWHATIADTTPYTTNNQSAENTSICPSGWRLPKGGDSTKIESDFDNDFWNLIVYGLNSGVLPASYGTIRPYFSGSNETSILGNKMQAYPNNLVYSGQINPDSIEDRGLTGYYWTSTTSSASNAYHLNLSANYIYPGTTINYYKYFGRSIRCIFSNPQNYTLSFNGNGGTGTPGSQTAHSDGLAIFTIGNTVPTRSGYTFVGWSDQKGNEVQPGGTFITDDTNATLFALWANNSCNPSATTIGTGNASTDAVCLQDVKPSMKSSLPIADSTSGTYTLIDARDGQSYTIAKLVDDVLWLTQNLNYGSNEDTLLTSQDTDLPPGTTFLAPASTTNFETTNTNNASVTPKILTDSTHGGYYSYSAAIANTSAYTTAYQEITTSICPKGWDLPSMYNYLNLRTISGNTNFSSINARPYSFIYAGYRNGTNFVNQANTLRLWTTTNYTASTAYYSSVFSQPTYTNNYKRYGESVRCIASSGVGTIRYHANDGTNIVLDQTGEINAMPVVKNNPFTVPNGYAFKEWNTEPDGSGISIAPSSNASSIVQDGATVNLYAIWIYSYKIFYDINNGDQGTMEMQAKWLNEGDSITLLASNFSRAGYGFAGWSTDPNAANNPNARIYGPNEQFAAPSTYPGSNIIVLHAVWVPSAGYFQNSSTVSSVCSNLTLPTSTVANISSISALTDQRDNETYAIAKLADGNCWMIENLRLNNNHFDNTNGGLAQGYHYTFKGLANPESPWNDSVASNSLYSNNGTTIVTISGNNQSSRFPRYNYENTNARAMNPTVNTEAMYSYGNYYTWSAAIADTSDYSGGNYTQTSICPSGWRLPSGSQSTANKSFGALSLALGGPQSGAEANPYSTPTGVVVSDALRKFPNNFVYSGYITDSSTSSRGYSGYYWSSTSYNYGSAFHFFISDNYVSPGAGQKPKSNGATIRCLAL